LRWRKRACRRNDPLLIGATDAVGPTVALIVLYGATLLLTELLSNATVAVLVTPIAVALATRASASARSVHGRRHDGRKRSFRNAVWLPTNVIVYQMGGYSYMDFVRVGLPLYLLTWVVAIIPSSLSPSEAARLKHQGAWSHLPVR
jgi:hypothetical protein